MKSNKKYIFIDTTGICFIILHKKIPEDRSIFYIFNICQSIL